MHNYPPGVTGNEPQLTGDWPCPACEGFGSDTGDEHRSCWYCGGTGVMPKTPPKCPSCGASEPHTIFFLDDGEGIYCTNCEETTLV